LFATDSVAARAGVISEIHRVTDQRGYVSRDKRKAIFEIPLPAGEKGNDREKAWEKPQLVGVFDVRQDYFERRPVEDPATRARLQAELEAAFRKASRPDRNDAVIPASEMSDEVLERLKSLGYLTGR
jgi:hypothetical protein